MSKFNSTKQPVTPTETNLMGEKAYKLSAKEELVATVLTTFVQSSYYEKENEIVNRIKVAADKCDPEFVAKLALYARREANMRSSSHLLAGELSKRVSGKEWASRFYNKIVVRPDDMSEILAYYFNVLNADASKKKIVNAIKKGFRMSLERLDAYQIDKYKMNSKEISLIDLVNLFHPKPNSKNQEAYRRLMNGESLEGLYTTKILEKEKSKAGQTATDKVAAKTEAIVSTLENNGGDNPIFNTIRNLVDIINLTPDKVEDVCRLLENKDKIINSRLLPFRFAMAYEMVSKIKASPKSSSVIQFESENKTNLVDRVCKALDTAMNHACHNIPKLVGNTAILIDHSGSVRGDGGGASTVSAFSKVTTAMIGNLFGCMLMQTQDNVFMGLFGDRLIPIKNIDRSKGILKNNAETYAEGSKCGGGTEHGIYEFFADCVANKIHINNVVIFSDQVIGSGTNFYGRGKVGKWDTSNGRSFQELFKEFRKVNPHANVISVDIHQTSGTSVFDKSLNVHQIAGWSDKIFNLMEGMTRGYADLVKEIEKIEI